MRRFVHYDQSESIPDKDSVALPFKPLDKGSYVPLYAQIKDQLRALIESGRLHVGDMLPSEDELSRIYSVSRMTARQAIQALKADGMASRQKGLGTFVAQPKVEKDIAHLSGFSAEMIARGMKPGSRVLKAEVLKADEATSKGLAISAGAPAFRVLRVRTADGTPVAIEESTLSVDRFPGIEKLNFNKESLYTTLRDRYGVRFSLADETLEAQAANKTEADLLHIPVRSSLLVISRVMWDANNNPIEITRSSYRGNLYKAVLRIPARTVE